MSAKALPPVITDTHCHLERFRRPPDVLERAKEAGVRVIAVTSRPSDFRMLFPLYGRREGVRLALGLHPLEVSRVNLRDELRLFASYADHTSFIGEIGLDRSTEGRESERLQDEAFTGILAMSGVSDKVATVHSRSATQLTIRRLVEAKARRVILHWFTGPQRDIDGGLDAGFYFSINPQMTRSKRGALLITQLPPERVLLESDGPYGRVGNRETEPRDMALVIAALGRVWSATPDEVAATLDGNLKAISAGMPMMPVASRAGDNEGPETIRVGQ